MNLKLQTNQGSISVDSSYSHESNFSVTKGNINLHNAHKSCKVFIEDGTLTLSKIKYSMKSQEITFLICSWF